MSKVVIVGAGPAGLFAALELADEFDVTLLEKGRNIGGSGLHSDGKINFHPLIGGDLTDFVSLREAWRIIGQIEETFRSFGIEGEKPQNGRWLRKKAAANGIRFIESKLAHIGSDNLPRLMREFRKVLEEKGVKIELGVEAKDLVIREGRVKAVKTTGGRYACDYCILAPGRRGSFWLRELAEKYSLGFTHNPIDVGVRVEFPAEIMEEIVEAGFWDPKFHILTKSYDDFVRNFCTNPYGFVTTEPYPDDLIGVNGYAMRSKKSENTNFALLVRVALTHPLEDTSAYGKQIVMQANILGGGKPLIQRLVDLEAHRRSTWERIRKSRVEPTLREVTPGDITMAYPGRIVTDLMEAIEKLDRIMPGLAEGDTLLYAPEIKFYALRIKTDRNLRTAIPNLFVAGDGAGVSRGINGAAATGIIAARGIKGG